MYIVSYIVGNFKINNNKVLPNVTKSKEYYNIIIYLCIIIIYNYLFVRQHSYGNVQLKIVDYPIF